MNFNGLTEFLKNVDHNLIHDCEIVVFKEHKCIYKNRFTADDVDPSEDKKDMYYLFSATKVITATATMRLVARICGIICFKGWRKGKSPKCFNRKAFTFNAGWL